MNLSLFAIQDTVAKTYLPPFTMANDNMAKRMFADCIKEPTHAFFKNPKDYVLHRICFWNNETGQTSTIPTDREILGSGLDFITVDHPLYERKD